MPETAVVPIGRPECRIFEAGLVDVVVVAAAKNSFGRLVAEAWIQTMTPTALSSGTSSEASSPTPKPLSRRPRGGEVSVFFAGMMTCRPLKSRAAMRRMSSKALSPTRTACVRLGSHHR